VERTLATCALEVRRSSGDERNFDRGPCIPAARYLRSRRDLIVIVAFRSNDIDETLPRMVDPLSSPRPRPTSMRRAVKHSEGGLYRHRRTVSRAPLRPSASWLATPCAVQPTWQQASEVVSNEYDAREVLSCPLSSFDIDSERPDIDDWCAPTRISLCVVRTRAAALQVSNAEDVIVTVLEGVSGICDVRDSLINLGKRLFNSISPRRVYEQSAYLR
jgi:hypothetical protein